jgi:hypothetical protein
MDENKAKIVDLSKFSKHNPDELDIEKLSEADELFNKGIEVFNESTQDATGFLAVTITEEGTPQIVWAGDVDTITTLGAIEVAKQIFIEKIFYDGQDDY